MSDVQRDPTGTGGPPGDPTGAGGPPGQAPAVPPSELRAASGPSGPRAGFWSRVGAQILDALVIAVPAIILFLILDAGLAYILTIVIGIAYFVYFEGGPTGQTLGKKMLNIRVIDANRGGPIGYGRALLRYVVEAIFSGILLLGYLWMLWDREKQTWHDKAASSVVVPVDAYPVQG
jgi:uncharacterized RDD family membrane protein YckC